MSICIRQASAADQPAIKAIIYAARLIPHDLDWQRFLVADDEGRVVGVGQVRPHRDGSRELASLAVIPERQAQGIGGALIDALLARESGTLYLMCLDELEHYYERFGFRRLDRAELPTSLRFVGRFAPVLASITALFGKRVQAIVMRRDEG
jgi:N-acetylglutamate synthase-like GNAT family acetyltransferase